MVPFFCFYKAFWNVGYSFSFPGILLCWFFFPMCSEVLVLVFSLVFSLILFSLCDHFYLVWCYFLSYFTLAAISLSLFSAVCFLLMEHSDILSCSSDLHQGTPEVNPLSQMPDRQVSDFRVREIFVPILPLPLGSCVASHSQPQPSHQ